MAVDLPRWVLYTEPEDRRKNPDDDAELLLFRT